MLDREHGQVWKMRDGADELGHHFIHFVYDSEEAERLELWGSPDGLAEAVICVRERYFELEEIR
ncbi:hypothetical protein EVJ58_g10111 [Rhodofomes roseus]|uniref:Uncharacterized protein n=1 Tax=Rhodofomes roseus TaxID=34475 RepID=A0A4Y9XQ57_9APHY|nr:hypothetical protein EVJ58_g10111 [Rhodofomes roseus]